MSDRERQSGAVGDHAITPELVQGKARRKITIDRDPPPAAQAIIADTATVIWAEIRGLRDDQQSIGRLEPDGVRALALLTDALTKLLREERRQAELDGWHRMTEAEIVQALPPGYLERLAAGDKE